LGQILVTVLDGGPFIQAGDSGSLVVQRGPTRLDDGILPVFRVGDNVRYPLDAVERFERENETQADPPNGQATDLWVG
jgi:hypothetical protein